MTNNNCFFNPKIIALSETQIIVNKLQKAIEYAGKISKTLGLIDGVPEDEGFKYIKMTEIYESFIQEIKRRPGYTISEDDLLKFLHLTHLKYYPDIIAVYHQDKRVLQRAQAKQMQKNRQK